MNNLAILEISIFKMLNRIIKNKIKIDLGILIILISKMIINYSKIKMKKMIKMDLRNLGLLNNRMMKKRQKIKMTNLMIKSNNKEFQKRTTIMNKK